MLSNVPLDTLQMLTMKRLENVLKMMEDETQRLANELVEERQKHQVTQDKLTAAEELANHQSVPSKANPRPPPFSIRLNS